MHGQNHIKFIETTRMCGPQPTWTFCWRNKFLHVYRESNPGMFSPQLHRLHNPAAVCSFCTAV